MRWSPGDTVCHHYAIERFLGAGGMGEVYRAYHRITKREVAIKAIRDEWKQDGKYAALAERFSKEATIWTRLPRNRHILEAIEFFPEYEGDPFLILEFIDGLTLKQLIERERGLDTLQTIRFAIDFCIGMEAAVLEGKPIVHRDVSHDNVMIAKAGNTLKINDFGLAKMIGTVSEGSKLNPIMGKDYFMSPEQRLCFALEDQVALDARTDIYAFGLTFQWALAGEPGPPDPSTLDAPATALAALLDHCIAPDRDDRPPSFAAVRERLQELLRQHAGEHRMVCRECGYIPRCPSGTCPLCGSALHECEPVPRAVGTPTFEISKPGFVSAREPGPLAELRRPEEERSRGPSRESSPPGFCSVSGGSSETGISEEAVRLICESLGISEDRVRHLKEGNPQRFVRLRPFAVGRHAVTHGEFWEFLDASGYEQETRHRFHRVSALERHPVTGVSWNDAMAYCRWKGEIRLPTRQEWEYAARGSRTQLYPWGNGFDRERCNTAESKRSCTVPVDHHPDSASPCGALQMTGNVWELTDSGSSQAKIAAGGSFRTDGRWQGTTFFSYYVRADDRDSDDVGFRVVFAPPAPVPSEHGAFVHIPAGEFRSGCERDFAESLVRKFRLGSGSIDTLTRHGYVKRTLGSYEIAAHPVTNAQFLQFVHDTSHRPPKGWRERGDAFPPDVALHPVTGVSYEDAHRFCQWARGRLPRPEEFERACRGQGGRYYPFGNTFDNLKCNTVEALRGRTTSVFEMEEGRSAEGVWDLCGNVAEWCDEREHGGCATMGGSFEQSCEVYGLPFFRVYRRPDERHQDVGFRCVRD